MPASAATIGATFAVQSYTLNLTSAGNGSVAVKVNGENATLTSDEVEIPFGAAVAVTATPNTNYGFSEWVAGESFAGFVATNNPLEFTMPAKDVMLEAQFEDATVEYAINVDGSVEGGTISADKAKAKLGDVVTLTATPNSGYQFVQWTVLDGNADEVTVTDNQFTMPASDVEVSATFKQKFTITYYVKGEENQVIRLKGDALALEAPSVSGMEFGGWSTTNDVENVALVSNESAVSADMTLYAVFVESYAEGTTYDLVEADQADWSGDYLIAYANSVFANGKENGKTGIGTGSVDPGTELSGKSVTASWGNKYYVTIKKVEGGYVMQTQDGTYNYITGSSSGISTSANLATATNNAMTITFVSSANIKIAGGTNMVFQYNTSGYFRFYAANKQEPVYLYKKANGAANYTLALPEDVTITDAKYATFCSEKALDFSKTGVKVYAAKATASEVELTEVTDGIVPAGVGVVLYSAEAKTVAVPVVKTAKTTIDDNEMVGVTARTLVNATEDDKTNYILANEPGTGIGFYKASNGYLAANRAYLSTSTAAAARFLKFADDNETTGIENIEHSTLNIENYYNLQGRRVAQPQKGLYIVNGKKVVIK